MKVAVVYQYYQGHGAPGHSLVYELTQYLAQQGHSVAVVSGETGYMRRDKPALPWYRRLLRRERNGDVQVVRTYTYSELHKSYLGRLLSFISFSLTCPLGLLGLEKPDVVLASSPPIFPMFPAWLVCKLRGIPFVLEVRDLWPASAVQMGILKNRQLIAIMSWMERLLYDQALGRPGIGAVALQGRFERVVQANGERHGGSLNTLGAIVIRPMPGSSPTPPP